MRAVGIGVTAALALSVPLAGAAAGATPSFVTAATFPYPQNGPGPITCVGAGFCMQLVYGQLPLDEYPELFVRTSTNGGTTWKDLGMLPNPNPRFAGIYNDAPLECASSTVCVVRAGAHPERTTNGGQSWELLSELYTPVVCLPSGGCISVENLSGHAPRTMWAARTSSTFRASHAPSGLPADLFVTAIACGSSSRCALAGSDGAIPVVAVTTTTGPSARWHVLPRSSSPQLSSLSCPSAVECVGIATVYTSPSDKSSVTFIERTTDFGAVWRRVARLGALVPPHYPLLTSLECSSALVCAASVENQPGGGGSPVSREVLRSGDGGAHWAADQLSPVAPSFGAALPGMSSDCLSLTHCITDDWSMESVTWGGRMEVTTNGTSWASPPIPPVDAGVLSLLCTAGDTCYRIDQDTSAAGLASTLMVSSDGGASWRALTLPAGVEPVVIGGCQSATTCELFGAERVQLIDGFEGAPFDLSSAVTVLLTTTDGGTTWSTTAVHLSAGAMATSASCTSTTACVAIAQVDAPVGGGPVIIATTNGSSWSTTALPASFGELALSVAAAAFSPSPLSCTASGFCMLGPFEASKGSDVEVSDDGGLQWKALAAPAAASFPVTWGIQCFGADSCDVEYADVGNNGTGVAFAQTTNGGVTWGASTTLTTTPEGGGFDLACTTLDECTAVVGTLGSPVRVYETANGGRAWTKEGWDATKVPPKAIGLVAVAFLSCSATACLVATEGAFIGSDGVTQLARMSR